jgi:hypothetical protein
VRVGKLGKGRKAASEGWMEGGGGWRGARGVDSCNCAMDMLSCGTALANASMSLSDTPVSHNISLRYICEQHRAQIHLSTCSRPGVHSEARDG